MKKLMFKYFVCGLIFIIVFSILEVVFGFRNTVIVGISILLANEVVNHTN